MSPWVRPSSSKVVPNGQVAGALREIEPAVCTKVPNQAIEFGRSMEPEPVLGKLTLEVTMFVIVSRYSKGGHTLGELQVYKKQVVPYLSRTTRS